MAELSDTDIRRTSMECASRAVACGAPTGHFLSSARMFETYIRSGLTQVGPNFTHGVLAGKTGLIVRVDAPGLSEEQAAQAVSLLREALTHIQTEEA